MSAARDVHLVRAAAPQHHAEALPRHLLVIVIMAIMLVIVMLIVVIILIVAVVVVVIVVVVVVVIVVVVVMGIIIVVVTIIQRHAEALPRPLLQPIGLRDPAAAVLGKGLIGSVRLLRVSISEGLTQANS